MKHNLVFLLIVLVTSILFSACNNDEPKPEIFLCCEDNPFRSLNINNTQKEILITNVFTPNNDGDNDFYLIPSLADYPNHSVTIYDLNDKIVYESEPFEKYGYYNWFDGRNQNTGEELKFGSYKYKIVIENEHTFLQYGYLCLIRKKDDANGFDFSNCHAPQTAIYADSVLAN